MVALMPYKDPARQAASRRASYDRQRAADPEVLRARGRGTKARQRERGIPPGAYNKYLGVAHGRPTEAQRVQLRAILDALPPPEPAPAPEPKAPSRSPWRQAKMSPVAQPPGERHRAVVGRARAGDLPAPLAQEPGEAPSRDRGSHLIARLLHDEDCDCHLCFDLRYILP